MAFGTDKELEAYIGVVVTRSVSRFEIVCVWVGTSTQDTDLPTGYDPERLYDAQTGSTFRLDGLSYGPWVDDPLQLDSYNAVHVSLRQACGMLESCCAIFLQEWRSLHRKDIFTGNTTLA